MFYCVPYYTDTFIWDINIFQRLAIMIIIIIIVYYEYCQKTLIFLPQEFVAFTRIYVMYQDFYSIVLSILLHTSLFTDVYYNQEDICVSSTILY